LHVLLILKHLGNLLKTRFQYQGQIIALDIYGNKLNELKRRAKRNGAHNIETRLIDSTKVIKKLYDKVDRVLIDAPCSGLGVLRRNPDAKWKLQPEFIENIKITQQEILRQYSQMVKADGQLVYATCSILASENQEQVEKFLSSESGKDFTFVTDKKILAHKSGFDGFYMALLQKKN
jgi:16S rRNA (cytosine967-C5)-methyltransferase